MICLVCWYFYYLVPFIFSWGVQVRDVTWWMISLLTPFFRISSSLLSGFWSGFCGSCTVQRGETFVSFPLGLCVASSVWRHSLFQDCWTIEKSCFPLSIASDKICFKSFDSWKKSGREILQYLICNTNRTGELWARANSNKLSEWNQVKVADGRKIQLNGSHVGMFIRRRGLLLHWSQQSTKLKLV